MGIGLACPKLLATGSGNRVVRPIKSAEKPTGSTLVLPA
jgi:hypothetical protein